MKTGESVRNDGAHAVGERGWARRRWRRRYAVSGSAVGWGGEIPRKPCATLDERRRHLSHQFSTCGFGTCC